MTEAERYTRAWADRRRRQWAVVLSVVVLLAVFFTIDDGVVRWACVVAAFALLFWTYSFVCPRCHKTFLGNPWWNLIGTTFAKRTCVHCGLTKDTIPGETP